MKQASQRTRTSRRTEPSPAHPWVFNHENFTLEYRTRPACPDDLPPWYVDLDECQTPGEALDWIFHVAGKWDSDTVLAELVRSMYRYLGRDFCHVPQTKDVRGLINKRIEKGYTEY